MRPRAAPRAVVLAALLAAGCSRSPQATPEGTLAAWVGAMNASRGDVGARRRAFELLAAPARASLTERAARASQLSGRDLHAWEMLAPGRFAMTPAFTPFDPDGLTAQVNGDHATVLVRGRNGERAEVPMVREGGAWRVELVLPAMQPIRTDGDAG